MPAEDFPALAKLTEDVVAAMHAAERREHRRHASRTRRRFGLMTAIAALLVPTGIALHATSADGATLTLDHHAAAYATAAGAGAIVAVAATKSMPTSQSGHRAILRPATGR
jgi:ferric-dicitrate binding protein FerR (iron transport regulator)